MFRTDDPVGDFLNKDLEDSRWLHSRPVCVECREHIQNDYAYNIPKWGWVCEDCINDFWESVED